MKMVKVAVGDAQWLISMFLPVYVVLYRECQLCDPEAHKNLFINPNKDARLSVWK